VVSERQDTMLPLALVLFMAQTSQPEETEPVKGCVSPICQQGRACDEKKPQPASRPNEQNEKLLAELDDGAKHFADMVETYKDEVTRAIEKKYKARRLDILDAYEAQIQDIEVDERKKRLDAIAAFETFLKKYPNDETFTPDAMFRLAELEFERTNDDYFTGMRAYEAATAKDPDQIAVKAPQQDYSKTVTLYRDLIANFPKYPLLDGAHYLLGYCLGEQGEEEQAVEIYTRLVERFETSRFVVEAWTRIGEYYFDSNQLAKAIEAYTHVLAFKTSSFYDKALYKLAWTYYRLDRFDEAVKHFADLVDDADAKKSMKTGGELRGEALQYMAVSFAEEKWGNLEKARAFFASIGGRTWAAEVYALLGEAYFDQSKFSDAIVALDLALKTAPKAPFAPKLQDKIVTAYERMRDFDGAAKAREALAQNFVQGSAWYQANASLPEVLAVARELSERSLMAAAVFHHRQAQTFKDASRFEDAKSEYTAAAVSYQRYLDRFASTKNRYEITYYLADCLYYSLQFGAAAKTFALVRDDVANDLYREPAAYSAVLASERQLQLSEQVGKLKPQPVLKSSERANRPAKALALPDEKEALVDAVDGYIATTKPNEKSPAIAFKAAEILYAYDHFEEARGRFQCIVEAFPGTDVARFSANLIIESYLTEKNWDAVERFAASMLGAPKMANAAFIDELKKFKLGAMFKKAEELETNQKYEAAAAEYIRVVDENPKGQFADKALNNAAVNYEKARRFESATRLYERIPREYPASPLADYALFRVGVASERFYDFDKAIAAYQKLVDQYPQSKHRPDAAYNAALALENTQRYERAIELYKRYADLFPDRKDAPDVFFRAARATEQASGRGAAIAAYEQFIKRYDKSGKAADERVIEAYFRMGELNDKAGNQNASKKAYATAVKESGARRAGQSFAAEAQFQLAEQEFRAYDAVVITGATKAQKAAIVKRAGLLTKVRDAYSLVFSFKQIEWTLAALFRIGNLYETFSEKLFTAPPPPEVSKLGAEYIEEYRVLIEEQAVPLEDKAVDAYKRTIAEAKKAGVANEWTKRTLRSLNKLRKKEFPLQKDAHYQLELMAFAAPSLVGLPAAASSQPATRQADDDEDQNPQFLEAAALVVSNPDRAAALFEAAAKAEPELCAAWVNAGLIHEQKKRPDKALADYRAGIRALPSCADGHAALASYELRNGSPKTAESMARDGLKLRPTRASLRIRLAEALVAQNRIKEAQDQALSVLKVEERNADAMLTLSRAYYGERKFELSLLAANNAREIAPNRGDIYHQLGVLFLQKNERPKALVAFKKAAELEPGLVGAQINASQLMTEAGDFEGALEAAQTAVAYAPTSAKAKLSLANAYRGVQKLRDAEQAYQLMIDKDAKDADALYNLGILYLDAELEGLDMIDRLQRSMKTFEQLQKLNKSDDDEKQLVSTFIVQARRQIDAEKKRREREEKRKARDASKAAASQPAKK
jgi:tetratricopeptide (TPR) repeat protein